MDGKQGIQEENRNKEIKKKIKKNKTPLDQGKLKCKKPWLNKR